MQKKELKIKISTAVNNSKFFKNFLSNKIVFNKTLTNSLITVLYHQVSDHPSEFHQENDLNVKLENFYNQLIFFKNNFNIISPHDLISQKFETPAILITFDDGEKKFFGKASEILKDLNLPCLHFLNMETVIGGLNINGIVSYLINKDKTIFDFHNNEEINLQNITKKQIENFLNKVDKNKIIKKAKEYHGEWASLDDIELCSKNNLIYFGNHFFNHYSALSLSTDEIRFQYLVNQKYLIKFKNSVNMFSYPYGQPNLFFNESTNNTIRNIGCDYIFTANPMNYSKFNKDSIYHRLPMHDFVDNSAKIKAHLVRPKIRNFIKKII